MCRKTPLMLAVCGALAACAGGSGSAPSLGYAVPGGPDATYVVGDTLIISLQGLGQTMEIAARSAATYRLHFVPNGAGVRVTATVEQLVADVVLPMAEPLTMDGAALDGDFVFELDSRGRASSMSSPRAAELGGQVFAAPLVAHSLFPRLPGRSAAAGDTWVDSVTYREETDAGSTQVQSSLTYTVVGDAQVGGRALLEVGFTGTARVTQDLTLEGASVVQASEVEVTGRMLWDTPAGRLYESEMTMEGPGTVRVALLPGATLPTRVRWQSRVSLQGR